MPRIPTSHVVSAIRSGMNDELLMETFQLSRKGYQRLLRTLVREKVMEHGELYDKSQSYRRFVDRLAMRRSPRAYVPFSIRVFSLEDAGSGFLRDISAQGVRVAGIRAEEGARRTLTLPLSELSGLSGITFQAVCRWTRMEGKTTTYPVSGFEITTISDDNREAFQGLYELVRMRSKGRERSFADALEDTEDTDFTTQTSLGTGLRLFSGSVDDVDILDIVQFMLLVRKRIVLEVVSTSDVRCRLYLEEGRVVQAVLGSLSGRDAFFDAMCFWGGTFRCLAWTEPTERSIDEPGDFLLVEAARRRDECAAPHAAAVQEQGA